MFSDSDSEKGEDIVQLTVNEHYAKAFNYRKEREELEKLKEKYGSDFEEEELEDESTDSESAESEDEDGEELTPAVDAAILRTLARIRKRDPAIYDSSKSIFGEEAQNVAQNGDVNAAKKRKDNSKPVTIRQANLDAVLHGSRSPSPEPQQSTHVEEQRALRQETIAAFHGAVSDDEDVDDLLIPREKTKDEIQAEEEEYKAYLERQVGEDLHELISVNGDSEAEGQNDKAEESSKKKKKKSRKKEQKSKADKDQEFLLDYILNRGWIDQASKRVPTYNEVTSAGKKKGKTKVKQESETAGSEGEEDADLSDSSFNSLADMFEVSYNHRFEEPDAATIPSFPRNIESTVRREDSKRKEARERRKARKEEELAKKREEVRRLKSLKMKEVKRKLEKIAKESGILKGKKIEDKEYEGGDEEEGLDMESALKELDLEGEWDPEKHDRQMEGLFAGDEGEEEDLEYDADGKPIWNDDIDIGHIAVSDDDAVPVASSSSKKDKKKKKKKKKDDNQDNAGIDVDMMDADLIGDDDEEWDGTEEMRKRKWKEYMAQLDEMDFNDLVGGMPTRFKYVPVHTQNYSLDPVEILLADDKDLNEYMSIKKYAPYRKEKGDRSRWDPKQREKLQEFKQKIKQREVQFFGTTASGDGRGHGDEEGTDKPKKKRKGKKERMKLKGTAAGEDEESEAEGEPKNETTVEESKSSNKKRPREEEDAPTKKKRRRRHGKKTFQV